MNVEKTENSVAKKPHDELFGRLVLVFLVLGVLSMVGFLVFLGYRVYDQRSGNVPSIADIPKTKVPVEPEAVSSPDVEPEKKVESEIPLIEAKNVSISVLNGSGIKGAAGALAENLKKVGFVKTIAGDAGGNYSGVTVFYRNGQDVAAKTVLSEVVKQYPKAVLAPTDPKRTETGTAPIVVLLGK
jgi:hypothetical protein